MSARSFIVAHAVRPACSFCATITKVWQDGWRWLRDPYRPERHYMRGPGPKCREKASGGGRG